MLMITLSCDIDLIHKQDRLVTSSPFSQPCIYINLTKYMEKLLNHSFLLLLIMKVL